MKRLAVAIVVALTTAGCDQTKQNTAKSDYTFENLAADNYGGLTITKVSNQATGRSVRVMRCRGGGLILLPSEF